MAKIDVYKYYIQCTNQVTQLNDSIKELRKSLGDKKLDSEKLQYLDEMVQLMKANCDTLGYVVYLLKQPRFGIFRKRYDQVNMDLIERFKALKVTKEDKLKYSGNMLDKIREYLKYCEDEINGRQD